MDPLTVDVIATIIAGILFVVGLTGIVLPVLPGSITLLITMLVWAIVVGGWTSWVAFGIVAVLCIIGMSCSYLMTGRKLRQHEVPTWPILVGIAGAIAGLFVIPFFGLFIGFVVGLYAAEWIRRKDPKLAWDSSWVAIKALGVGIALELTCGLCSTLVLAIAAVVHFATL